MNEAAEKQSASVVEIIGLSAAPPQLRPSDAQAPLANGNKADGQGTSVLDEKTWQSVNARRSDLIRQKYTASLTSVEQAELDALEETATKYLNAVAPLPDYPLNVLQAHVDRLKANQKNGS